MFIGYFTFPILPPQSKLTSIQVFRGRDVQSSVHRRGELQVIGCLQVNETQSLPHKGRGNTIHIIYCMPLIFNGVICLKCKRKPAVKLLVCQLGGEAFKKLEGLACCKSATNILSRVVIRSSSRKLMFFAVVENFTEIMKGTCKELEFLRTA